MALGTLTLLADNKVAAQHLFIDTFTVVLDSSYATGGMAGLEAKFETAINTAIGGSHNRTILAVMALDCAGYLLQWIPTTAKLKAYRIPALDGNAASAQALAEVGNAVDLSGVTATLVVFSK